ncbi:MAG: glycosyltransferase [Paracoccaceae bacterium]
MLSLFRRPDRGGVLVSAALIVRNEERHLEACLASLAGFVDEIVVVDTGSRDGTLAIAEAYGAQIGHFPWIDDFSAARNAALDRATGRWILYIDADERLVATVAERAAARRMLATRRLAGAHVRLQAHKDLGSYRELRLFRNDPRIRFEGIIHETIWPALERYRLKTFRGIGATGLRLEHVGYEGPQDHKYARDKPLLLRELARKPDHLYCWYHLGIVERGLGNIEAAREAHNRAIEVGRKTRPRDLVESLSWCELIGLDLDEDSEAARKRARTLIAKARARFPKQPRLEWLAARILMRDDRLAEANKLLRTLRDRSPDPDDRLAYDPQLFGLLPTEALARNLFKLEDYAAAAEEFAEADRLAGGVEEFRIKQRLSEGLAREKARIRAANAAAG